MCGSWKMPLSTLLYSAPGIGSSLTIYRRSSDAPAGGEQGRVFRPATEVKRSRLNREELLGLLAECEWNKAEVARRLGVSHTSVLEIYEEMGYSFATLATLQKKSKAVQIERSSLRTCNVNASEQKEEDHENHTPGLSAYYICTCLRCQGIRLTPKDKPIEIVFSTYMPTSYPYLIKPLENFMETVEKQSGNRVKFKFFHSGQLYKGKEEFAAMERGEIDMCAPNDLYLTGIIPDTGISNLPFLWDTPASMQKSLDAGLWDLGINQKFEQHNAKVLGLSSGGSYQIYVKGDKVHHP